MSIEITVAGRTVEDALSELEGYAKKHGRTLERYDLAEHSQGELTEGMVTATRVIASRISNAQRTSLVQIVNDVDWTHVPVGSLLKSADPIIEGGLFDAAIAVFDSVKERAPKGVRTGKISKVLHLMRPGLFPILDTRIRALYRSEASSAAVAIKKVRPELDYKKTYWGAIRNDVITNETALAELRRQAAQSENPLVKRTAAQISDVRMLDLLAWRI